MTVAAFGFAAAAVASVLLGAQPEMPAAPLLPLTAEVAQIASTFAPAGDASWRARADAAAAAAVLRELGDPYAQLRPVANAGIGGALQREMTSDRVMCK